MNYEQLDTDQMPKLDEKEYPTDKRFEFVVFQAVRLICALSEPRTEIEDEKGLKFVIKFAIQCLKFYKWWWKN